MSDVLCVGSYADLNRKVAIVISLNENIKSLAAKI